MNGKKWTFAALIAVLVIGGFVWQNARKAVLYSDGLKALESGQYAQAMKIFAQWKKPYKDSELLLRQAQDGRIEELCAVGDWEGALALLPATGDGRAYEVKIRWGEALAAEGHLDEAMELLEERIANRRGDDFNVTYAKGRAMIAAGEYARAEAYFREMQKTYQINKDGERVWEALVKCIYLQYLVAEEAGDKEALTKLEKRVPSAESRDENDQWIYIKLGSARHCAERGDYVEAAKELSRISERRKYYQYPELNKAADTLTDKMIESCIREERWGELYRSFPTKFSDLAQRDAKLTVPYHLAATNRTNLIGTDPDFETLIDALPAKFARDGEALFKELTIASGDAGEQYKAARNWARENGREYELLSYAMDVSAASAAGENLPVPTKPELLAVLPAATEYPGSSEKAAYAAVFREAYGPEDDFRAIEPRPGYYIVLAADGYNETPFKEISTNAFQASFELERIHSYARLILDTLSKKAGEKPAYSYRAVDNPNTASLLVVLDSNYREKGNHYHPKSALRSEQSAAYTGFAQVIGYTIYDTRAGGIVGSGEVETVLGNDIVTGNTEGHAFWQYVSESDLGTAKDGSDQLRAATDAAVAEFCDK